MLKPPKIIFWGFTNRTNDKFGLVGADQADVIVLQKCQMW